MKNYKETKLSEIPFTFLVRTNHQTWGKGKSLTEAMKNAGVSSLDTEMKVSCVNEDVEIDGMGTILYAVGHNDPKVFKMKDLISAETLMEYAIEHLRKMKDARALKIVEKLDALRWDLEEELHPELWTDWAE